MSWNNYDFIIKDLKIDKKVIYIHHLNKVSGFSSEETINREFTVENPEKLESLGYLHFEDKHAESKYLFGKSSLYKFLEIPEDKNQQTLIMGNDLITINEESQSLLLMDLFE